MSIHIIVNEDETQVIYDPGKMYGSLEHLFFKKEI